MKKLFILIVCFLLSACASVMVSGEVIIKENDATSSKIKLSMVGDALIHESIYKDALEDGKYNFSKMVEPLKSSFADSDLMYYNQESLIGGEELGFSGAPKFNTPEKFGRDMLSFGFNMVTRANEHIFDLGEAGVLKSCNFWNKHSNILTSGSACTVDESLNIKIMENQGIKYTILNYTTIKPEDNLATHYLNVYEPEKVKNDIENIRGEVDVIIVAMHWGIEYDNNITKEQKEIATYLAELGVDIVVGTHPHVIQPIEYIGDTIVIYSLGNFISGEKKIDYQSRRIGLLVHVDITKTSVNNKIKVELSNLYTELIYTSSDNSKNYQILPFSKLDDSILRNYKDLKVRNEAIIKKYEPTIKTT